jgi:hypothetical protein
MIPVDATQDDLKGIREMLDVVIKRHFKAGSEISNERKTDKEAPEKADK